MDALPQPALGFAESRLLRHGAERDDGALAQALTHPEARTILVAGDVPILRRGEPVSTGLLPLEALARLDGHREQVLLGLADGHPVLATLARPEASALFPEEEGFKPLDLRTIAIVGAVPADELGLLATAKSVLAWHDRHRFCANCGNPTVPSAAGFRRDCAACGTQHFPRTDPVAIMMVTRGESCLLGRQARFAPGVYSCLAGFIEPGETIEDAVRRETFEEAGVRVGAVRYGLSQPWPFPSSLMIGCFGEALSEELALDRDELEDGRWFSRDEVRSMLERRHPNGFLIPPPMAIAHHLIRRFVDGDV